MPDASPTALSLLPALVTIVLAFATRQVIASLFAGILTGSLVVVAQLGGWLDPSVWAEANPIRRFLLPSLGAPGYAKILLIYLWCLGGLIGLWERTGGARHFAETVGARVAHNRHTALFFGWLLGIIFHQGGTVSTVLTGSTVKPVADKHKVSHEELSYVVDSTSSPVATLLAFNAWPAYVAGVVVGTVPAIFPDAEAGVAVFWRAVRFNFYAIFAVLTTLLFSFGLLPWMGRSMLRARLRSIEEGQLDRPGSQPMLPPAATAGASDPTHGYEPHLADFLVPLLTLLGLSVGGKVLFDRDWVNEAFLCSALSAMGLAWARGLSLDQVVLAFVEGCQKMTLGAIVLGLAVTLGGVSKDLGTGAYVVQQLGESIAPIALPAVLMLLCMGIAFATGTSWGTYAVVFPLAMPLAWAVAPDPVFIEICFGAVLGGAVFGDQCSPISDTTILSSMFTGCDHVDHVRTQLPLAFAAATVGALCSTFCVATLVG